MTGHLRAFGYVASQGRIMLPWSIFQANGVRESEIFSGTNSEGLHEALGQLRLAFVSLSGGPAPE